MRKKGRAQITGVSVFTKKLSTHVTLRLLNLGGFLTSIRSDDSQTGIRANFLSNALLKPNNRLANFSS